MRIHFVGSEGASMKVLAQIAEADGIETSGSDVLLLGHSAAFAEGADAVVYSSAVKEDAPELVYARNNNIPVLSRAEYLGKLASRYKHTVAVAGSHGKTTVTAMLGEIFAPYDSTVHLGGTYNGKNGRVGGKNYFITEACEYKRNFLYLTPKISVVLNVELDHTDYYRDLNDITSAFNVFSRSAPIRILSGDDEASEPLRSGKYITFGLGENCDYRAVNCEYFRGGARFTLFSLGKPAGEIQLKVMGKHNVLNAVAACATAAGAGLGFKEIKSGLERFEGVSRRLEYVGNNGGCDVYCDYAHHPHEIESVIACIKEAGYKRVGVVFEPHTYSRTLSLMDGFASALSGADKILLAEIFAARESPINGVGAQTLCRRIINAGKSARAFYTYCELNEAAEKIKNDCDAIIYCGAGSINTAANLFVRQKS